MDQRSNLGKQISLSQRFQCQLRPIETKNKNNKIIKYQEKTPLKNWNRKTKDLSQLGGVGVCRSHNSWKWTHRWNLWVVLLPPCAGTNQYSPRAMSLLTMCVYLQFLHPWLHFSFPFSSFLFHLWYNVHLHCNKIYIFFSKKNYKKCDVVKWSQNRNFLKIIQVLWLNCQR